MTTLSLSLDCTQALAQLQALAAKGTRLRPLFAAIGESLLESTRERFSSGVGPDGSRWLPNSPVTIERYLARFSGSYGKTGKRPLIGESKSLSTTINWKADDAGVSIGSPLIYAGVQQFGAAARAFGRAPWGRIPARPFLGVSSDDSRSIVDLTTAFLASP